MNSGFGETSPLFGCQARKDGNVVAMLRAFQNGGAYVVEASVFSGATPGHAGPYHFASEPEARAFVTDAREALAYLGCDVS